MTIIFIDYIRYMNAYFKIFKKYECYLTKSWKGECNIFQISWLTQKFIKGLN